MTMTLMKKRKVIKYVKQEQNLFIFKLVATEAAKVIRSLKSKRVMIITGWGRPTHLVSQNEQIRV